VATKK